LEAPSASNRVNFELLAQYNPAMPVDRKAQQKAEKHSADGERASQSAPPPHPAKPRRTRTEADQAVHNRPGQHTSKPKSGGQR